MAHNVPAHVSQFAARHNVDLAKVTAAAGDGLTLMDIAEHARKSGDGDLWAAAISAQFVWNSGEDPNTAETAEARQERQRLATEDAAIDGLAAGRYTTTNGRLPGEWSTR